MKAHSYYRQYSQWSLEAVVDRFATLNRFVENDLDSNSFVYNHMYLFFCNEIHVLDGKYTRKLLFNPKCSLLKDSVLGF